MKHNNPLAHTFAPRFGNTAGLTQDDEFSVNVYSKQINVFSIYIDSEIVSPQDFRGAVQVLSMASENDEVNVYLNSNGGSADGGMSFLHAANDCKAEITYHGSGTIASMAAIILCSAERFTLSPHSSIMLHTASGGAFGTMKNAERYAAFNRKNMEAFCSFHCAGVLTRDELRRMYDNNEEFWFTSDEFTSRWQRKQDCKDILFDMVECGELDPQQVKAEVYTEIMLNLTDAHDAEKSAQKPKPKKRVPRVKKED